MAKGKSPESRSPAVRSANRVMKSLEFTVWHVMSLSFVVTFLLTLSVMYTFQPGLFFSDDDFLAGVNEAALPGSGAEAKSDNVFSDKGRSAAFLWSFVVAVVVTFLLFLLFRQVM